MKTNLLKLSLLIVLVFSLAGCGSDNNYNYDSSDNYPVTGIQDDNPQVKKSTSGICHEIGSTYYSRTMNFIPYDSISECLDSGGRLPKK